MKTSSINDWLYRLGSKTPTPGGGAVAALNGAIAAAQLKMVFMYSAPDETLGKQETYDSQIETFLNLAEADSSAYNNVREAYASKDQIKINKALLKAIKPSMDIIANCEDLTYLCEENYQKFNRRFKADLIVVLTNLRAAVQSAAAMVAANLHALEYEAPQEVKSTVNNARKLLKRIDNLCEKVEDIK